MVDVPPPPFERVVIDAQVEIGYGVAPERRGRGVATAAVSAMLDIARSSGEIDEVIALISPENIASGRVATGAGFEKGEAIRDDEGEDVMVWRYLVTR